MTIRWLAARQTFGICVLFRLRPASHDFLPTATEATALLGQYELVLGGKRACERGRQRLEHGKIQSVPTTM